MPVKEVIERQADIVGKDDLKMSEPNQAGIVLLGTKCLRCIGDGSEDMGRVV